MGRQILTNKWTMSSADIPAQKAENRVRRWCWCDVLKKRVTDKWTFGHRPKETGPMDTVKDVHG